MRILLKSIIVTLIVTALLSLSACNSGGISGTGSGSAKYIYRFLPSKLIVDLPDNLVITEKDATRKTSTLQIFQEISLPFVKINNLTNQLDILHVDAAFDQMETYCQNVAIDEVCNIPAGEIYFTFTQAMANTQRDLVLATWRSEGQTQQVIDEGLADLDNYHHGLVGDLMPLHATRLTKLNGIPYDYNIKQLRGSIFNVLPERVKWSLSWTADKTKAQVYMEATLSGTYGIFYSFYQDRADGSSMTTRNATQFLPGGAASVTKISIKERLDAQHGVNIRASSSDTYADGDRLIYTLEGVVNTSGGYAFTHVERPLDVNGSGFKLRETIDTVGAPLDYERCLYLADGNVCNNDESWYTATDFEPREDIKDSDFFTIYNAIEDFSASLDQAEITVQNIPAEVDDFVITDQGFPEKREALMCSGQRSSGELLLHCGVDAATLLQMNLQVFKEVVENGAIQYHLLDTASVIRR